MPFLLDKICECKDENGNKKKRLQDSQKENGTGQKYSLKELD